MSCPSLLVPQQRDFTHWLHAWDGCTVFVLGTGPGLSSPLLERIRQYAAERSCPVVAVESAFQAAPWADVLFFSDLEWWGQHKLEARRKAQGRIVSPANAVDPKVLSLRNQPFTSYRDPGADALSFVALMGARRVVLVGFDDSAQPRQQAWAAVNLALRSRIELLSFHAVHSGFRHVSPDYVLQDSLMAPPGLLKGKVVERRPVSIGSRQAPQLPRGWAGRWTGKTAFVLASGPSLTAEDVGLVYAYVQQHRCPVLVTNTTFQLAPWADVLFFHDKKWWQIHGEAVQRDFSGQCVTMAGEVHGRVISLRGTGFNAYRNSGGGAISLAMAGGATRIILLGLDGKYAADGRRHWHVQHPKLGDAVSLPKFVMYFPMLAKDAEKAGVEILNASRDTALTCFPRVSLEDVLSSAPQPYAE